MASYLVDTHHNVFVVDNSQVYYVDVKAKRLFPTNSLAGFFTWFKEHRADGEQLYHLGATNPLSDVTVDELART